MTDSTAHYFASGANTAPEIRAFALSGSHVGVSLAELADPAIDELLLYAGAPLLVFADTGAFGEVEEVDGRLQVTRPIEEREWSRRLRLAHRLAAGLGSQVHVVAPDCVADQARTLDRMRRFAVEVRAFDQTVEPLIDGPAGLISNRPRSVM